MNGKVSGMDFFSEEGPAWFALTLFLCYLTTMAVQRLDHVYLMMIAVCMGMMAGYDSNLGGFLTGMRFFTFYPFFLFGYCCPTERILTITERKTVRTGAAVLLVGVLYVCLRRPQLYSMLGFLKGKAGYEKLQLLPWGGIYRGFYYIAGMILVICVLAVVPAGQYFFSKWGGRTIQVFAIHFPIIAVLKKTFHMKELLAGLWPEHYGLLLPILALVLTVVLSQGFLQPFFRWLMHPPLRSEKTLI
jgi:fucose 4-O-acetylase-like acetyltransferase